jgi:tRNA pseudouridine38-40 synthase
MERYQVILAYDGTNFSGSQYQVDTRTVQSVVEAALRKLNWAGKSVLFAGRTDTGVHASGQVVAFDLDWSHPPLDLRNALNSLLPDDVAVYQVSVSPRNFRPRYHATARRYRYRVYCQPVRDPLLDRYAWRVWPVPDFERLGTSSQSFIGTHDFSGFGRATSPGGSSIRQVITSTWREVSASQTALAPQTASDPLTGAGWTPEQGELWYEITANSFLYHMVRRLVFVQVQVGQGRLSEADLRQYLQSPGPDLIPGLAPPQGLTLVQVYYPPQKGEVAETRNEEA